MEMISKGVVTLVEVVMETVRKDLLTIGRKKASGQRESVRDTQATTWNSLKRELGQSVNRVEKKNWKYISTSQHIEDKFHMDQNLCEKTKF